MDITKDTPVEEVLSAYPALSKIFIKFGLPCFVCGEPYWGTIEDIAEKHDISIDELLNKLHDKKKEIDEKL
jgi:hybrid cluster-associated redox disulfide protein